jgi:uncharacterized protein (TIGR02001 family)
MNKLIVSIAAGLLGMGTAAMAADMPAKAPRKAVEVSPWDIAFGGALMSDYNFRGISQSDRGPSVTAYVETRYTVNPSLQLYAGSQYWSVDLPTGTSCECDFYAGFRPTVGPLAFDFGFIYYWYPRERQVFQTAPFAVFPAPVGTIGSSTFFNTGTAWTPNDGLDYWEVYGKVTWDVIKDKFALGANFYYSPDWLGSGAYGFYASGTAKLTMQSFKFPTIMGVKEIGWYISGEVGHYSLGTADNFLGLGTFALPDYWTWNLGVAFTQGVFTLDFRYYDTDLSKGECLVLTADLRGMVDGTSPGQSKWCNPTFIVATKFDLTVLTNVK